MDTETVLAAIGSGLLSGGGAGYLTSWYQIRKESEHNANALQLEREKLDLERGKWEAEQSSQNQASLLDVETRKKLALFSARDVAQGLTDAMHQLQTMDDDDFRELDAELFLNAPDEVTGVRYIVAAVRLGPELNSVLSDLNFFGLTEINTCLREAYDAYMGYALFLQGEEDVEGLGGGGLQDRVVDRRDRIFSLIREQLGIDKKTGPSESVTW